MPEANHATWHLRAKLGLAAIVVAVFLPTVWFTQVAYDDQWLWAYDSPLRTLDGPTLNHVFFDLDARSRHDIGTEYLPVRDLVVAADMAVWDFNYRGPHRTQLVLFVLTVVGLFSLLVRFGLRRDVAWIATLLWAIHPLHVEPVAWVSERKGILAGLFVVLLGHAWVRYREHRSSGWLVCAVIAAVAGVWSKAPAMFAPLLFATWDFLLLPAHRRRWIAVLSIGFATALAAVPVIIVARGGGIVDNAFKMASDSRPLAALGSLGHYVLGVVAVREPSISYPLQTHGAGALELVVGALALAAAIVLAVMRRWPQLAWRRAFVAWALVWFIPISHLLVRVHIPVADRYVYLWTLAACAGVGALLAQLRGIVRLAAVCALAGLLAIQTIRAQGPWTGGTALFAHGFAANPADVQVCTGYAHALSSTMHDEAALAVLQTCLVAQPEEPYLLAEQASVLDSLGRRPEALAVSARAAASGHASLLDVHAIFLMDDKRYAEALPFAERAALRRPEQASYTWHRVSILVELARFSEALVVATELATRIPGSASEMVLARVFSRWGKPIEAEAHLIMARLYGAYPGAIREIRASQALPAP